MKSQILPGKSHINFPTAHVIDLDGKEETGDNVETRKRCPERDISTALHHSKHSNEDDKGKDATGSVCISIDVGVAELVDLEHAEDGDGVHKGSVKLEVRVVRTNVIAARHHAFHDQSKTHGIKHAGVLRDSIFPVHSWVFLHQLPVQEFSPPDKDHEEPSKHHIANVGEDMVEVREQA